MNRSEKRFPHRFLPKPWRKLQNARQGPAFRFRDNEFVDQTQRTAKKSVTVNCSAKCLEIVQGQAAL
jgi:hypothetical protein